MKKVLPIRRKEATFCKCALPPTTVVSTRRIGERKFGWLAMAFRSLTTWAKMEWTRLHVLVDFGVGFQRRYGRSSPGIYIAIVGDTVRTRLSQDHRKAFQSPESKCRRPLGSRACELHFRKALH